MFCLVLLLLPLFVFNETTSSFHVQHDKDGLSHGVIEQLPTGRKRFFPLPQSTLKDYARLRPDDFKRNRLELMREHDQHELIGPSQWEQQKIWFGNKFYDGEGATGLGAFGYFDTESRTYTLFSPSEVACCEMSALLVQPDVVWIALDHNGEDISNEARWLRPVGPSHTMSDPLPNRICSDPHQPRRRRTASDNS